MSAFPIQIGGKWTAMGRDGLVRRCPVEGADDGGVEYELTPLGRTLLDVIEHTRDWARSHLGELVRARDAFGRATTASTTVARPT